MRQSPYYMVYDRVLITDMRQSTYYQICDKYLLLVMRYNTYYYSYSIQILFRFYLCLMCLTNSNVELYNLCTSKPSPSQELHFQSIKWQSTTVICSLYGTVSRLIGFQHLSDMFVATQRCPTTYSFSLTRFYAPNALLGNHQSV